jgi:error-prone DNA polymerase
LVYVSSWLKCHYPEVFMCALINSQPMGFYAPAQIVRDARDHGVEVHPVDVAYSNWDCTLECAPIDPTLSGRATLDSNKRPLSGFPARLGMRLVDGLNEVDAQRIVAERESHRRGQAPREPFAALPDFMIASGIKRGTLDKLAAADAFRSMKLDRREALWEAQALIKQEPLPLFAWSAAQEAGIEPAVELATMPLSEHVVADYQTLRLSLKAHPLSFLRSHFDAQQGRRIVCASRLAELKDGAHVAVAGVVLVRQRPGSAKGVVFMTIEDETGVANAVVWPKTLERYRRVVMGARLVLIYGRVQRHESIVHIVSQHLEDRSDWLSLLADGAQSMKMPLANADEVTRPDPGSARGSQDDHPRFARQSRLEHMTRSEPPPRPTPERPRSLHPRGERVIPKSRDFH